MTRYVGAIDQGTTSTRFMVFDHAGREAARYMTQHQRGTLLFTGATASVRGAAGFASGNAAVEHGESAARASEALVGVHGHLVGTRSARSQRPIACAPSTLAARRSKVHNGASPAWAAMAT